MLGFEMLDVLIGLVTVYLAFGIACTAIVEAVSSGAGVRARNLKRGMEEFFEGAIRGENGEEIKFADAFYAHPLVETLSRKKAGRPSYIPTVIVGRAVESLLGHCETAERLKETLEALPKETQENRIKALLLEFHAQAGDDVHAFREKVEAHFDASMERVAGWYKRKTQYVTLFAAVILVGFANVDSIEIVHFLSSNPEARTSLVQSAGKMLDERKMVEALLLAREKQGAVASGEAVGAVEKQERGEFDAAMEKMEAARVAYERAGATLGQAGLKLGWERKPVGLGEWLSKIVGLLVSALAVSMGAPFWFQVLQRFMQVRGAGLTPGKKI